MLKREQEGTTDPVIVKRVSDGAKLGKRMNKLRKDFSRKRFKRLRNQICASVARLEQGEKILMPVSYVKAGEEVQMLMELGRDPSGKFTVALISHSEETRALFDREQGVSSSQSPRREIGNVELNDLLAMLSVVVELDTSPRCRSEASEADWETVFMQALKLPNTTVRAVAMSAPYAEGLSSSHVGETLSYLARQQKTPLEAKRFELAARLRIFLDLTGRGEKALKDPRYWRLVRTSAHQLARMIESDRQVIGDKETRPTELTRIFYELQQMIDRLDTNLPELVDLRAQTAPYLSGTIEAAGEPAPPPLQNLEQKAHVYAKDVPPFEALDETDPVKSVIGWGERCRALIDANETDLAGREAALMTRMLPELRTFIGAVKIDQRLTALQSLNAIAEAVARSSFGDERPSLYAQTTAELLHYYSAALLTNNNPSYTTLQWIIPTNTDFEQLFNTRMPEEEKLRLQATFREASFSVPSMRLQGYFSRKGVIPGEHRDELQHVYNIAALSLLVQGKISAKSIPSGELTFGNFESYYVTLNGIGLSRLPAPDVPLKFQPPIYAEAMAKEVTSHYTTEYCCLGCISDNCPNYNEVPKEDMRFHPLYMLHNYVDEFCKSLIASGKLHRDEAADLMYTQQTNQDAKTVFVQYHQKQHATRAATGFDDNDRRIQAMNTLAIFLEHPHFFKHPDLCWQFETRLFTHGALQELFKDGEAVSEHKPFLLNVLRWLNREIPISYAAGNLEVAGYLLHVSDRISKMIKEQPDLSASDREELLSVFTLNADDLLLKWSGELVGKTDEKSRQDMRMILPLLMNSFHTRFVSSKGTDPSFNKNQVLQTLFLAAARIEELRKGKDAIDPEVYARYEALMAWLIAKAKEAIEHETDKGDFINAILTVLHPDVAALRLEWDANEMPTVLAIDLKTDDFFEFDLTTGQLTLQKKRQIELPNFLQNDPEMKRLFGPVLDSSWQLRGTPPDYEGEAVREFTHPDYKGYRVLVSFHGDEHVMTKSSGRRFVIERSVPVSKTKHEWMSYKRFEEQDKVVSGGERSEAPDIPCEAAQLIGDRQCWINRSGKKMYVLDQEMGEVFAIITLKRVEEKVVDPDTGKSKTVETKEGMIRKIHLVDQDVDVLSPESEAMERFTLLDDPSFIIVSGHRSHPDTVQFSRYQLAATEAPLIYEVGKKSVTTTLFSGYDLAPYGARPGSRDPSIGAQPLPSTFDVFHLLRKEGEERVLVPFCEFEQEFSAEGSALRSSRPVFTQDYGKVPVYEYKVDPDTNRLVAQSGDGYAYLAYLCLTHWDYGSAAYYLDLAKTSAGYSERYDAVFKCLDEWTDDSPNGVALRLRFHLLRENVYAERASRAIAEGRPSGLGAVKLTESNRLIALAELYLKYTEQTGMGERSPALDLSIEQEEDAANFVQQLIEMHGDEQTKTNEPVPVRAVLAPLQTYLHDRRNQTLGIREGTLGLWVFKGNDHHSSPLVVNDPRWVLKDFRDVFNKLLDGDPESVEFKLLVNQLRMLSEFTGGELDEAEQDQIRIAQSYLLKLASAKMNDPGFITDLKEQVLKESDGRLPKIKGPWFLFKRAGCLAKLDSLIGEEGTVFDQYCFVSKERARAKAQEIIEDDLSSKGKKKTARRVIDYLERTDVPDRGPDFKKAFREFILREALGDSGARSVLTLNGILEHLDGLTIKQPRQVQAPLIPRPVTPRQTYRDKYGPLLTKFCEHVDRTAIELLEARITGTPVPLMAETVTTPDHEKKAILHEHLSLYETGFEMTPIAHTAVSEAIFDRLATSSEPAFRRVAEEHRKDLRAFEQESETVSLKWGDAEKLYENLTDEMEQVEQERDGVRQSLLQYVEKFDTPAGELALKRLTGAEVKPSLEVLVALWRQGEIQNDWDDNPLKTLGLMQMTPVVLAHLDSQIAEYMQLDVKARHLKRTVDASESYLESCAAPPEGEGDPQLALELWEGIHTHRHFALSDVDARDLLYLEYSLGIVLRPQQVHTLRDMLADPNAVRQLIMGGGKSKVLLPLLAKRKANGTNLVMLMLPDELYETNCRDLDATNRLLFRQEMHRFDFSRKSDRSEESLLKTYEMLLRTVKDQGYVMTTKSNMLSFKNAYIDLLYKLQKMPADSEKRIELIAQVRVMSKILKLFKNQTDVIADEIDACLDVRKEVNFSLGDPEMVDRVKVDTGNELISLILQAKENDPLYELRENLVKNTQATLSPERRAQLLRSLAEAFVQQHAEQIQDVLGDQLIDYLMDDTKETTVRDWVFALKDSGSDGDLALFHQITTVKAFLDRGFGTTFGRIGNVNYGRDPVSGVWTIPYKASNTPRIGSEFDDDIERLAFTYQDYLQNGVRYQQVYQSVAILLKQAVDELRSYEGDEMITLNDTVGAQTFNAFLREIDPTDKLSSLTLSQAAHPKRIEAIAAAINATPEGRIAFCHSQVVRKMKQYDAQIHSNSQDLVEMVHSFGGFTGTLWNLHTYHDKINAEKSLGVDGQTWSLMLGRDVPVHTFDFDADRPIESLVDGLDIVGNYQALIDAGAYLRGVDNHEFIDYCMENAEESGVEMGGGIYFDKTGRIVKKGGVEEKPLAIEAAPETDKMTNFTLYDQSHTVGADIKQGKRAVAVVTVGENTFVRDLLQADWRLRELHREQRVVLAISQEIKDRILSDKTEGDLETVTKEDILRFCLQNEARRETEDNFRAEKEKIHGTAKRYALTEMVDIGSSDLDDEGIVSMARELATPEAGLFIKQRPKEEAYDEYGRLKVEEDPDDVLPRMRKAAAAKCDDLAGRLEEVSHAASDRSRQKGQELLLRVNPPADWTPSKVDGREGAAGGEVEQEAQAEVESTLELMVETETVQETEIAAEVLIPMAQSGAAGHGEVHTLESGQLNDLVKDWSSWDTKGIRPLGGALRFFDEAIFTSAVYERNLPGSRGQVLAPRTVFYSNRKPVKYVIIAKNADGKWGMVIPTIHEAHHAAREWIKTTDSQAVEVKISTAAPVIMYKTGKDRSDRLPFDDEDLASFYRLYVQAKLLNGEISFETKEEKEALKAWLKEVGVEQFALYFQNHILPAKPKRFADAYSTSSLYRIIQEVKEDVVAV